MTQKRNPTVKRWLWYADENGKLRRRTITVARTRAQVPKRRQGEHAADCSGGAFYYRCIIGPKGTPQGYWRDCQCGADAENARRKVTK